MIIAVEYLRQSLIRYELVPCVTSLQKPVVVIFSPRSRTDPAAER